MYVWTLYLNRTHNTSVRHAHKLKVCLVLTISTDEATQVPSHSLDERRASLAPTLMSSPAAVSYLVTVVQICVAAAPTLRLHAKGLAPASSFQMTA